MRARASATQHLHGVQAQREPQRAQRAGHIEQLLTRQRAVTVLLRVGHDSRYLSTKLWAESIELLGNIGAQAGGWLKKTNMAPAA